MVGASLREEVITIDEFLNLLVSNGFEGLPCRFNEMLGPALKVLAAPAAPDGAGAVLDECDAELEEDDACALDDGLADVGGAGAVDWELLELNKF